MKGRTFTAPTTAFESFLRENLEISDFSGRVTGDKVYQWWLDSEYSTGFERFSQRGALTHIGRAASSVFGEHLRRVRTRNPEREGQREWLWNLKLKEE